MNLRIEAGILLKPYTRPLNRRTGEHRAAPVGWTPVEDDGLQAQIEHVMERAVGQSVPIPAAIARQAAEVLRGRELAQAGQPWPGWVPVSPVTDKDIARAYKALFIEMNEGKLQVSGDAAKWPPDGDYVFEKGKIRREN